MNKLNVQKQIYLITLIYCYEDKRAMNNSMRCLSANALKCSESITLLFESCMY